MLELHCGFSDSLLRNRRTLHRGVRASHSAGAWQTWTGRLSPRRRIQFLDGPASNHLDTAVRFALVAESRNCSAQDPSRSSSSWLNARGGTSARAITSSSSWRISHRWRILDMLIFGRLVLNNHDVDRGCASFQFRLRQSAPRRVTMAGVQQLRVVARQLIGDFFGLVVRSIIDDQDLEIGCDFRQDLQQFFDTLGKSCFGIMHGQDNT